VSEQFGSCACLVGTEFSLVFACNSSIMFQVWFVSFVSSALFLAGVTWSVCTSGAICHRQRNAKLHDDVIINTKIASSAIMCTRYCESNPECMATSYQRQTKVCELGCGIMTQGADGNWSMYSTGNYYGGWLLNKTNI
jgi:hypothetical protein